MATVEERVKILQMLQEGKLSPEESAQLLQVVDDESVRSDPTSISPRLAPNSPDSEGLVNSHPRWLRVRVTDADTGRPRVNVRLPLSLVKMGLKLGSRYSPEIEGLDLDELLKAVEMGDSTLFVDVLDEEDGERVEVFLE